MKKIFTDEQLYFIKENYKDMTYKEMSDLELFKGLDSKQIRTKASTLGLYKTRRFNKDYFNTIDTKDKAYWLGFIYADGWIVVNNDNRNYEMGISLKYEDKYILECLNKCLGNKHIITTKERDIVFNGYSYKSKCSTIRVYSKEICEGLLNNGVTTNKTDNADVFPTVSEFLFSHFLRGFYDGDGCLYYNHRNNKEISFTNSSYSFLNNISQIINKKLNVDGRIYKESDKKYKLVFYRKEDANKLIKFIYEDSNHLKLERKYLKYKNGSLN